MELGVNSGSRVHTAARSLRRGEPGSKVGVKPLCALVRIWATSLLKCWWHMAFWNGTMAGNRRGRDVGVQLLLQELPTGLCVPPKSSCATQARSFAITQTSVLLLPRAVTLDSFLSFSEPQFGSPWKELIFLPLQVHQRIKWATAFKTKSATKWMINENSPDHLLLTRRIMAGLWTQMYCNHSLIPLSWHRTDLIHSVNVIMLALASECQGSNPVSTAYYSLEHITWILWALVLLPVKRR